jgi:hypothetical protein
MTFQLAGPVSKLPKAQDLVPYYSNPLFELRGLSILSNPLEPLGNWLLTCAKLAQKQVEQVEQTVAARMLHGVPR